MDLSRGIESHNSHWCQQYRHSWTWHLTERETKQGMLANTLVNEGSHLFFSGISHRLTQNLLYLLFTVIHQAILCLHLICTCFLWAELPCSDGDGRSHGTVPLFSLTRIKVPIFSYAGLWYFASAEDTWKALKNKNKQSDGFYSGGKYPPQKS